MSHGIFIFSLTGFMLYHLLSTWGEATLANLSSNQCPQYSLFKQPYELNEELPPSIYHRQLRTARPLGGERLLFICLMKQMEH